MIGGYVIEVKVVDGLVCEDGSRVARLWIVDTEIRKKGYGDETLVNVKWRTPADLPIAGEQVWWQGRCLFARKDTVKLEMVCASHDPKREDFLELA